MASYGFSDKEVGSGLSTGGIITGGVAVPKRRFVVKRVEHPETGLFLRNRS
jgi:hypothetical protein